MTTPRKAIVTGGANGIGKATVTALESRGDVVVGIDIEQGHGAHNLVADLTSASQTTAAFDKALEILGRVDVLVNVAGVFNTTTIDDFGNNAWTTATELDLNAALDLMRRCKAPLIASGSGRIVNVTSIHGQLSQAGATAYAVAKAGLEAATRSVALELAPHGVLVNAVAPGFVHTRMSILEDGTDETQTAAFAQQYVDSGRLPLGRPAEAHEIAAAISFLSSTHNTYITGQVIAVDGGLSATF